MSHELRHRLTSDVEASSCKTGVDEDAFTPHINALSVIFDDAASSARKSAADGRLESRVDARLPGLLPAQLPTLSTWARHKTERIFFLLLLCFGEICTQKNKDHDNLEKMHFISSPIHFFSSCY